MRLLVAGSACLLLLLAFAVSYRRTDHEKEIMDTLFFECEADGEKTAFQPWEDEEEGVYYLVLPSCFRSRRKEFTVRYGGGGIFRINGVSYTDGDLFCPEEEESYSIGLTGYFGAEYMNKTLQVLVSENLPALLFSVEAAGDVLGTEEFEDKRYLESGKLVMLDEAGTVLCSEELERFKKRGNLTATLDKRPFSFTFKTPREVCGMAPARKWNLLANATDGSYMRNKIVLDLANESIDGYEPDGEFAEVWLNGVYQGLYLLTEAVEAAPNRLELPEAGSWLLEMELDFRREEGAVYITTQKGQLFEIESSEKTGVSEEERERISNVLNDIESALYAQDGTSPASGRALYELIDLDSWAEAFLIQGISGDHDTGIASQFGYLKGEGDSRLYAGPVWDYDGAMGNVNTAMYRNPKALTASVCQTRPDGNANQNRWLSAMYRNDRFRERVEEKYEKVFRKNLEDMLLYRIDGYADKIARSAVLDALRWHGQRLSWMFVIPPGLQIREEGGYERFDTLDVHTAAVKEFLSEKKDFLDKLWVEKRDYCVVEVKNEAPFLNQDYNQTLYYWVERGTAMEGLPCYENEGYRFYGYRDPETGRTVSDGDIIDKDCTLEGVWEEKG